LTGPADLRTRAEELAAPLPPLLAAADHLASTVLLGAHGRRRTGTGDEFWQYRQAMPGDEARMIDWRRSGRSDVHFVREKEWQAAQSVLLWVDRSQSMGFASSPRLQSKSERARLLALALASLLVRGGEGVGLTSLDMPPRSGELQLLRLTEVLADDTAGDDYGTPEVRGILPHSRAVFVSDFLGDVTVVEAAIARATDRGVSGAILQVLDPQEEAFPFDGRTIFESMGRSLTHETLKAGDLRSRYLERLAERKDRLLRLARATGWQFDCHHTDRPASGALLWLYRSLERVQH
jgi:uncharacterized protein (DUF58 family)